MMMMMVFQTGWVMESRISVDCCSVGSFCAWVLVFCVLLIQYNACVPWNLQETVVCTEFSSLFLVLVHCHPDCLTCSHSPDHCDLCRDPTKLLQNGRCVHSCGLGFYQAGSLCLGMTTQRQGWIGLKRLSVGFFLQLSHSIVTEGTTVQGNIYLKATTSYRCLGLFTFRSLFF